jgi:NAD(P)-dependent dehydrogenase (short-subunit alcohol dehydrogenase family)
MKDKVIIITGASDGIGAVAARRLHELGAEVVIVGRSPEKTRRVASALHAASYIADFAKLSEVRTLAAQLKSTYPKIDVLINNAGGIFGERELTEDGNEKTLQVNHLAPFLLTHLLLENLTKSAAVVINVSSIANKIYGNIDINDLNLTNAYSPTHAYGNGKLGNILFTMELNRRYGKAGIKTVAVHPGNIATNFANDTTSWLRFIYHTPLAKFFIQPPEKGADPLVWLATSTPGVDWEIGAYYDKLTLGETNSQARDQQLAIDFWNTSLRLTGLHGS